MEWISVENQLPELFKKVIAYNEQTGPKGSYTIGEKYFSLEERCKWQDGYRDGFRGERFFDCKVTHWMPLPNPPLPEVIND